MSIRVPNTLRNNEIYCIVETDSPIYNKIEYQVNLVSLPEIVVEPPTLTFSKPAGVESALDLDHAELLATLFFNTTNRLSAPMAVLAPPYLAAPTQETLSETQMRCAGPHFGCDLYTCLGDEDKGNGRCGSGMGRDFHILKTFDYGQNGCFQNSETNCTPKANVMACYATYYGLNFCPPNAVVCKWADTSHEL